MQSNRSDGYETRREVHVLCFGLLRATQEALVENLVLEDEHGASAVAAVAIPLNWIQHILVEVGVMLDATAAAVLALAVHHSVVERLAVAVLLAAQVVRHWIQTEESDQ